MPETDLLALHPVERPRERLAERGARALGDEELLAVLLRTGYAGRGVLALARELLSRHPDGGLARLPLADLRRLKGVGLSRACALAAGLELGRRWGGGASAGGPRLDSPERVREQLADFAERRKEHFIAFYLDACHGLLHRETVSVGTLTASLVHPREVFAPALAHCAASVLVAHNHPSGNPEPSAEDRRTTTRLCDAGRLMGIPVLDHVIIAGARCFSFRENGLL